MATTVANTEAAPVVVSPSGSFDGNDGPWSTFNIHVGTPPQPVRVLVGTNVGETWVILANRTQGGCLATDPPGCAQARGGLFSTNSSTTWQDEGIYELGIELNLDDYTSGYEAGDYGFDAMGLGLAGSSGVRFDSQTIAAIATKDFYLGYLGVTNHRTNFTSFENGEVSFLESMKASGNIPSMSYAYSAGAKYRNNTLGTLTLGGYDNARAIPNQLSFSMAPDISRDLVVGLQSISLSNSTGNTKTLSSKSILTFIDATVPHIWLPEEVCSSFEDAFGLTYNSTIERYLVNDTLHNSLQKQNFSVSFLLGNDTTGDTFVNITLPYSSFDLELGPPFVNTTQSYFPLRRAANASQYTLGRTFLQEAYLIVDYERSNFSVSQNSWSEDTTPQIVPISSTTNTTNGTSANNASSSSANHGNTTSSHKLPAGTIAGIVVTAFFIFMIAAATAAFYFTRRRRIRKKKQREEDSKKEEAIDPFAKAEMDGSGKDPLGELDAPWKPPPEADGSSRIEMPGDGNQAELAGNRGGVEMEGSSTAAEVKGDTTVAVEMDAGVYGLSGASSLSPRTSRSDTSSSSNNNKRERPLVKRKPLPILPT